MNLKATITFLLLSAAASAQTITNSYTVTATSTNVVTRTLPFDGDMNYVGQWRVDYQYDAVGSSYHRSYTYHDLNFDGVWDFYIYSEKRDLTIFARNVAISPFPYRWYYAANAFVPNLDGKSVAAVRDGVEYPTSPTYWFHLTNWSYSDSYGKTGAWSGFADTGGAFDLKLYGPAVNNVKPVLGKYRIEWAVEDSSEKFSEVLIWKTRLVPLARPAVMNLKTFNVSF